MTPHTDLTKEQQDLLDKARSEIDAAKTLAERNVQKMKWHAVLYGAPMKFAELMAQNKGNK